MNKDALAAGRKLREKKKETNFVGLPIAPEELTAGLKY